MSGAIYGGGSSVITSKFSDRSLLISDEVGALVLDVGNNTVRAGYGGEDSPKFDVPSIMGVWSDSVNEVGEPQCKNNIGTTAIHVVREGMELSSFLRDGMIENWDMFENLTDYIYNSALKVESQNHPILISEPPWITPPKREQLTELMYEKYKVPALYLAKNAALAAFANGRPTCLVVDSGATHTTAAPVLEGIVLTQAVVKSPVGGDFVSAQCRNYLEDKNIQIIPPYMVAGKEVTKPDEAANWKRKNKVPKVATSWHNYMVKEVMQDFQASVLQVADTQYDEEVIKTMPAIHYEFPHGFHKDFGVERFKIPEPLFNPATSSRANIQQPSLGVASLVTTSVGMCDIDIRPSMYSSVVVTGGNTNIQGFNERLNRDLAAKTPPSMRLKLISSSGTAERKFGAWIGGSILSSLGSFQQLWISKQEYEEGGKAYVHSKCP